jgi:cytochrome c oxidase subunit 3
LAHHFDTPEQQYISAKLGMWIFLGTEILMFGGLFCAYSVYRHNHPEVFEFAHQYLDKLLGGTNTLVLITSSLTMAWAVRSSQLGDTKTLRWLLALTILGGYIFLGIKSVEYHKKWEEAIFIGPDNKYRPTYTGSASKEIEEPAAGHAESAAKGVESMKSPEAPPTASISAAIGLTDAVSLAPPDPNIGTGDAATVIPRFVAPQGVSPVTVQQQERAAEDREVKYSSLTTLDRRNVYTFFGIYFVMTGLHGLHVVIGMSLIMWVLLRALGPKHVAWAVPMVPASIGVFLAIVGVIVGGRAEIVLIVSGLILAALSVGWAMIWVPKRRKLNGDSEFGPTYFTPVDLVGLYWHLVDLIWIFLFPLLYLIH